MAVLDISAGGFMVALVAWQAEIGERVMAKIDGLGAQASYLVWSEDGRAGIAFEQPLHAAVYDRLAAQLAGREADLSLAAVIAKEAEAKAPAPRRSLC